MSEAITISPLGDSAVFVSLGNHISEELNRRVIAMHNWLQLRPFEGMQDIIIAYSSLSILYDPAIVSSKNSGQSSAFHFVKQKLEECLKAVNDDEESSSKTIRIPVCYDAGFGIDINAVAKEKKISVEEIIQLHTSKVYRVYMIGFLPGFPYMGKTDDKLTIHRKSNPVSVAAGSVGIADNQTGIYSLNSPGGWHIIGRTPATLFDRLRDPVVTIQAGDKVEFYKISGKEMKTGRNFKF